ncbi:MAG: TldD/PmbA family protein [Bacteroidales bacterium]|nr:TldD/PmbA family protein [Bacteroidales bacterium]
MTAKEKQRLAERAINIALDSGAQESAVIISDSKSSAVEVREGKIDKLEQSDQMGLSIRLLVDNKFSAHSTNRLDDASEVKRFIQEAVSATRFLSEDPLRALPDPGLYYQGGGPDLKLWDETIESVDPRTRIDAAFAAEKEIAGSDERIISVSAGYSDGYSNRFMVTSNGFRGEKANTFFGMGASVSVRSGEARPEGYWSENSLFYNRLQRKGIGEKALDRAIRKIGQRKIASGRMSMIVENRIAGRLLGAVITAMNGSSIQQKNSFLIDALETQIASEALTVTDDPFVISGQGSAYFDSEGLAMRRRTMIEKGVLKDYYINTYYGRKLEMNPNSGDTSNLIFGHGENDFSGLAGQVQKGVLVTGFNGGNSNGSTGDFSFGIEGFYIERGEILHPVSEMNISGNMKEIWKRLAETGNDPYLNSSWQIPSMLFNDVDFSGI